MDSLRKRGRLFSLAALMISTALGCSGGDNGGGGSSEAADEELATAVETTLSQEAMSFQLDLSVEAAGQSVESHAEGEAELSGGRGDVRATSEGVETRIVVNGDEFWLTTDQPDVTELMPDGKEWVHGSFSELGENSAVAPLEPLAVLYLLGGANDIRRSDAGDGSSTFEFGIDLDTAVEAAPADRQDEVAELITGPEDGLSVTGEAEIDGDDRVRQLDVRADAEDPETGESGLISYLVRLDDFGAPVDAQPPDEDDVVELEEVPDVEELLLQA